MGLLIRVLYAAAVILFVLMILALLKVIAIGLGWVGLLIAAVLCVVAAYVLATPRTGSPL